MAKLFGGGVPEDYSHLGYDNLSVILSEDAVNTAVWTIQVWCKIGEGRYFVGNQVTVAANVKNALVPSQPTSRVVCCARIPGARVWWVSVTCPVMQEAELMLDSTNLGGGSFGLTAVSP